MQRWIDVLFLHAPVPATELQRLVPPRLEVETFEGQAWVSYVLFRLKLRPAGLPHVPGFSSLVELNLRTYVRHRNQGGIYFLRMYANNRLAVTAARWLTPLDYRLGRLVHERLPSGSWQAECESKTDPFRLSFHCRPASDMGRSAPGSLDEWLLERYRLYVGGKDRTLIAADVEHEPWEAARMEGEAAVKINLGQDMAGETPTRRLMHYSPGVTARFHEFRVVETAKQFSFASALQPVRAGDRRGGR